MFPFPLFGEPPPTSWGGKRRTSSSSPSFLPLFTGGRRGGDQIGCRTAEERREGEEKGPNKERGEESLLAPLFRLCPRRILKNVLCQVVCFYVRRQFCPLQFAFFPPLPRVWPIHPVLQVEADAIEKQNWIQEWITMMKAAAATK